MSRATLNKTLNGDIGLSTAQRGMWYALNVLEQMRSDDLDCPVLPFIPREVLYPTAHTTAVCSPSRVWSDLFWLSLNQEALRRNLGPLHLLEIGCGDGRYFDHYDKAFGGLASYIGIDPRPRDSWLTERARRSFRQSTAEEISPQMLADTNMIVSQSALEHIPDDVGVFKALGSWAESTARPTVQVHILPASNMWRQYGIHGFSGYSGQALRRLTDSAPSAAVYLLGGRHSLQVHYRFVKDVRSGFRTDRRSAETQAYSQALLAAIDKDIKQPPRLVRQACFLALVLVHNTGLQAEALTAC